MKMKRKNDITETQQIIICFKVKHLNINRKKKQFMNNTIFV